MTGREKDWTIEEQAAHWERRKKHIHSLHEEQDEAQDYVKRTSHKPKKIKLDHRFIDFDDEAWYE